MTLEEEMQQWEDEHYTAEDRVEEAARPKSEWMILAAAMDSSIFEPIPPTRTTHTQPKDQQESVILNNNTNKKKKEQKKKIPPKTQAHEEKVEDFALAQLFFTVAELIDEDIVENVAGTLLENPFDEDTREFIRGIVMEALSSQIDIEKTVVGDSLFAWLDDFNKQQQQGDTTTTTHPRIANPSTNTQIPTTTNKTHTQPKD